MLVMFDLGGVLALDAEALHIDRRRPVVTA